MTTDAKVSVRLEAYRALAEAFKEPSPGFAADVATGLLADVLAESLGAMGVRLEEPDLRIAASAEEALDDLLDAYHALFVVPSRRFVLPVESTFKEWQGGDGLAAGMGMIFGPPALDMADRYRRLGLEVPREMRDTPDHLTLLLEYGALLAETRSPAEQREFVEAHLDQWVEAFVDEVEALASSPCYRALARALRLFVRAERRHLGIGADV